MIRNLMLGMSLVTLSTVSAFAAPVAATHHAKAKIVAQAPAADAPAPSTDKPVKKASSKKAPKKAKAENKMENKGDVAPTAPSTTEAPKAK